MTQLGGLHVNYLVILRNWGRMEVAGYSTVNDGGLRVQYCGGWRSEGTVLV
jgi:hypothetical protein